MPTDEQLANRMNPIPVTKNILGNGAYLDPSGRITLVSNGTYGTASLQSLGNLYAQNLGGDAAWQASQSGGVAQNYGRQYLSSIGVDINSLPKISEGAFADFVGASGYKPTSITDLSMFQNLVKTPATAGTTVTQNQTPNILASGVLPGVQPATIGLNGISYNANLMNMDYKSPETITSQNLTGGSPTNFQTGTSNANSANAALASINAEAQTRLAAQQANQLGPKETDLSRRITELMAGNESQMGRTAYQQQQNQAAGVDIAQATKNSLEAQQRALLAEAAQIDLSVQQGQGVTTAINQRQRDEAKRVIAVKTLVNSALIAAADGDLLNAQTKADRAVQEKYGPIEEAQKIRLANLDLLLKDPDLTLEEKKRTDAQAALIKAQDEQIAQARIDMASSLKIAVDSSASIVNFTATAQYQTAAQAIDAMTKVSPAQALAIAMATGLTKPPILPASAQEYEYAKSQGYSGTYTQYQNDDANRKAKISGLSASNINTTVNQIAGSFDNEQIVKDYNQISQSLQAVKTAGSSPTDDIQRVYAFAKIMDPNSVVRESEYATVEKYSQALLQHAGLKVVRVFSNTGFLTPEARILMQTTLENRFAATERAYKNLYSQYQTRIETAKRGEMNSLTDYSAAPTTNSGGDYNSYLQAIQGSPATTSDVKNDYSSYIDWTKLTLLK